MNNTTTSIIRVLSTLCPNIAGIIIKSMEK